MQSDKVACCTCGYSWERGQNGSHDCASQLRNTLRDVVCVAVSMLYVDYPDDILAAFKLEDLDRVVSVTDRQELQKSKVEDIYKRVFDLVT